MTGMSEAFSGFNKAVSHLEKTIEAAVMISEANMRVHHTGRQNRPLFLLAKLIAHALSMQSIVNSYLRSPKGAALLDHFSIASLTRVIIEASLMTMYISHPSLKRDEWNLRRYVLYLHDLTNRKRFLTASQGTDEAFLNSYPGAKAKLIGKIAAFATSVNVDDEIIKDLIKGQQVFVYGMRGAVREACWDIGEFDFLQSYLSAFIHSHPVSFMRADEHQISFSDPGKFQLDFSAFAINTAADYLNRVQDRMASFSIAGCGDPLGQVDD